MWLTGYGWLQLRILTIVCLHQKMQRLFYSPFLNAIENTDQ
jgi:hypothetical protein